MELNCTLEAATPADLLAVRTLLEGSALPTEGLIDQFPDAYVLAWAGPNLVGAAGLEVHERAGLLRSVAVAEAVRGSGVGARLVRDRLQRARAIGLARVFLLTTTAAGYFQRLGFSPVDRSAVPAELAKAPEFSRICPESAVCLAAPTA